MMKICLISNLYSPYVLGGAEVYVQRIAQKLAEKHQVTVITQQPFRGLSSLRANEEIQHEVKIYRFYPLNFYFTYYANKAPKWFTPLWHLLNLLRFFLFPTILYYTARYVICQEGAPLDKN